MGHVGKVFVDERVGMMDEERIGQAQGVGIAAEGQRERQGRTTPGEGVGRGRQAGILLAQREHTVAVGQRKQPGPRSGSSQTPCQALVDHETPQPLAVEALAAIALQLAAAEGCQFVVASQPPQAAGLELHEGKAAVGAQAARIFVEKRIDAGHHAAVAAVGPRKGHLAIETGVVRQAVGRADIQGAQPVGIAAGRQQGHATGQAVGRGGKSDGCQRQSQQEKEKKSFHIGGMLGEIKEKESGKPPYGRPSHSPYNNTRAHARYFFICKLPEPII